MWPVFFSPSALKYNEGTSLRTVYFPIALCSMNMFASLDQVK